MLKKMRLETVFTKGGIQGDAWENLFGSRFSIGRRSGKCLGKFVSRPDLQREGFRDMLKKIRFETVFTKGGTQGDAWENLLRSRFSTGRRSGKCLGKFVYKPVWQREGFKEMLGKICFRTGFAKRGVQGNA